MNNSIFIKKGIINSILLLSILIITSSCKNEPFKETISLAGDWKFQLDPQNKGLNEAWFNTVLPDDIQLPGSCEEGGFGVKNEEKSVWALTRVIKYEGKAWYQKEVTVPQDWNKKRVQLFLERCYLESTVWVDGKRIDTQNSMSTPHIFDLGIVEPGTHKITNCVDNTYKIPIGSWASAITEDTQGNWNGIIGRIELTANDPVWIKNIQVHKQMLRVEVGNKTDAVCNVTIESKEFTIPVGGTEIELPFTETEKQWDEFAPKMHDLTLSLKSDKWNNSKTISYALRDLDSKNKQFTLNGRPLMLRGPVDECVYPKTGYPPMDKEAWLRVFGITKDYGFNFMRFHSWCPPEAAFQAADELGFLIQVELPLWTMDVPHFGEHKVRDEFVTNELKKILKTYGNHPSFGFMAMGNESSGSLMSLVNMGRDLDKRHLYRCENGVSKENGDFFEVGERGVLGASTDWDRSIAAGWILGALKEYSKDEVSDVPTFSHEVGQWAMYPDFDEIEKFDGTTRAYNYESYREALKKHNMLDQAKDFTNASGKLSVLLYKEEIEACLRTYPYGGFQILEARDYPGQGTAIVGWLDAFWDSKGLITPEKFQEFCGPTVCLLRMPKRTYTPSETFSAKAEIAHYGPTDITANAAWKITNDKGVEIAKGKLNQKDIKTGALTNLGEINASLNKVTSPEKLVVTLSAGGFSNSWNIWVYPSIKPEAYPNVHIAYRFNSETKKALAAGKKVLLFSSPKEGIINHTKGMIRPDSERYLPAVKQGSNAIPGSFMPVFWNTRLFQQIGTLGILCNPEHPAFKEFPTEKHSDWQWADLLGNFTAANSYRVAGAGESLSLSMEKFGGHSAFRSKAIILDETPADFRPILQVIDNYDRNAKLGSIFETKVGNGKLLVCALDLDSDASDRPEAQQLRKSLLDYINSDAFKPSHELNIDLLDKLLINK